MATYNGEAYIENQLYSLLQQTEKKWKLWIRDDGSNDNTVKLIEYFVKIDSRINFISDTLGQLGPGKSFLELTKYADSQYIIFCDQDDIWLEKKLELLMLEASKAFEHNKPCLVYCDGFGYSDKKGTICSKSISRRHANTLNEFLFFNSGYQGCSILFNRELCEIVSDYQASYFYLHDDVVSLIAHAFGKVSFLNECLMLYRQHDSNVTGNINNSIKEKILRLFRRDLSLISIDHYTEKKSFFEAYKDRLSDEDKLIFEAYLRFPDVGLIGKLYMIFKYKFSIGGNRELLIVKTLLGRTIG